MEILLKSGGKTQYSAQSDCAPVDNRFQLPVNQQGDHRADQTLAERERQVKHDKRLPGFSIAGLIARYMPRIASIDMIFV